MGDEILTAADTPHDDGPGSPSEPPFRCLILGAAGRDFHNFRTFFRQHPQFRVCAFTSNQIPFTDRRSFPRELAGPGYEADLPIFPEAMLPELIDRYRVDFVCLAYSDLPHAEVMHKASLVQSYGAGFLLLGPAQTQLAAQKPVIAVTAVRTGAGKSPLTRWLTRHLAGIGRRPAVVRHPMPYGNLQQQAVQRFAVQADLDRFECTIEEREEYQPYLDAGFHVFAGVDYEQILRLAEDEADVILWDGGNNDFSFFVPGLSIVVADALRPGHERAYYPGETNFRSADILVINKVADAEPGAVEAIRASAAELNPQAAVITADLQIHVDGGERLAGRRVLVVEDGPTLTHGGMAYGAGTIAARQFGAAAFVDPRPAAVGSIADAFRDYPHLGHVLPALGYSAGQCQELQQTIVASGAEAVVDASPAGLRHVIDVDVPVIRVAYEFAQVSGPPLDELVTAFVNSAAGSS